MQRLVIDPAAGFPESSKSVHVVKWDFCWCQCTLFFSSPVLNLWPCVLKGVAKGVYDICLFLRRRTGCDQRCSMVLCFTQVYGHQIVTKGNHIAPFMSSDWVVSTVYCSTGCSVYSVGFEQSAFFLAENNRLCMKGTWYYVVEPIMIARMAAFHGLCIHCIRQCLHGVSWRGSETPFVCTAPSWSPKLFLLPLWICSGCRKNRLQSSALRSTLPVSASPSIIQWEGLQTTFVCIHFVCCSEWKHSKWPGLLCFICMHEYLTIHFPLS